MRRGGGVERGEESYQLTGVEYKKKQIVLLSASLSKLKTFRRSHLPIIMKPHEDQ